MLEKRSDIWYFLLVSDGEYDTELIKLYQYFADVFEESS